MQSPRPHPPPSHRLTPMRSRYYWRVRFRIVLNPYPKIMKIAHFCCDLPCCVLIIHSFCVYTVFPIFSYILHGTFHRKCIFSFFFPPYKISPCSKQIGTLFFPNYPFRWYTILQEAYKLFSCFSSAFFSFLNAVQNKLIEGAIIHVVQIGIAHVVIFEWYWMNRGKQFARHINFAIPIVRNDKLHSLWSCILEYYEIWRQNFSQKILIRHIRLI